ncbi:multicopy suppressor of BFA (Brefeldin A) [Dispira parvispora]|uniref:Multicopy suppressor of BFA (Brefeldin A) n=1 Tax=Dispira parvispora TaxID=1520584 RepID=A0A9W8AML0_9FUNG|nr:multicopy suppressor of BFA (Brefeldin A) [Dispira parvispora]
MSSTPAEQPKRPRVRPDLKAHRQRLQALDDEIQQVQQKYEEFSGRPAPSVRRSNPKPQELASQLESMKKQQATEKAALQASIRRRLARVKQLRDRCPCPTIVALEARIGELDQAIESGKMKLVEERQALNEIATLRKSRKNVEAYQEEQQELDREHQRFAELFSEGDTGRNSELNQQYKELQALLDEAQAEDQQQRQQRQKAVEERQAVKKTLDDLYQQRRTLNDEFYEAKRAYEAWLREDRKRREAEREQRRIQEAQERRQRQIEQEKELAEMPAFESEITACESLLKYLEQEFRQPTKSGNTNSSANSKPLNTVAVPESNGVAPRRVDTVPDGVRLASKSTRGEDYFFSPTAAKKSSKHKKKGKKGGRQSSTGASSGEHSAPSSTTAQPSSGGDQAVSFPLGVLESFWEIRVDPPTSVNEIKDVVQAIVEKKDWYLKNQIQVTADKKAKVEKKIQELAMQLETQAIVTNE